MSKVKGPFTYEAPKPEDIKFIPLNQSKEINGKELMEFYEVHHKSVGVYNRMTNILGNIYILFVILLDILSFMILDIMFSVFHQLSIVILQRLLSILQTFLLNVQLLIRLNLKSSSIQWSQCSPSTVPNHSRNPFIYPMLIIVSSQFKFIPNITAAPVSVRMSLPVQ